MALSRGASSADAGIAVANQQTPTAMYEFGLAQQALVNGVSLIAPINALPLLFNEEATFMPTETVSIFLSSYAGNGVPLAGVPTNALTIELTPQTPVASVGFNDATNAFYLVSLEPP